MKYYIFIFCTLFFLNSKAQERTLMQGMVASKDSLLTNVHVRNISSGKFSVSGEKGLFQLNMKIGDTLVFSHVGMEDLISFIKPEDLHESSLFFKMNESTQELREVVVNEHSEINAVSLGIIPKRIEKLSTNERRLRTAGDFKPIHLLSILGGTLQVDPILNAINGRTKKLKRNIEVEKFRANISFLEMHYKSYMEETMNLTSGNAALLINFMLEREELPRLLEENNDAEIKLFLHDSWFRLNEQIQAPQK